MRQELLNHKVLILLTQVGCRVAARVVQVVLTIVQARSVAAAVVKLKLLLKTIQLGSKYRSTCAS